MIYDVFDIAAYCVNRCIDIGMPIKNLQLQKALYYIQANFLCTLGQPCFNDDFVKWHFGPVIESIYNYYRRYMANPIGVKVTQRPTTVKYKDEDGWVWVRQVQIPITFPTDDKVLHRLDSVCASVSSYDSRELILKVKSEAPLKNTGELEIIPKELIEIFYKANKDKLI